VQVEHGVRISLLLDTVTPQKSKAKKKVNFPYSKILSQQKLGLILSFGA
jgi:hypothetical protein